MISIPFEYRIGLAISEGNVVWKKCNQYVLARSTVWIQCHLRDPVNNQGWIMVLQVPIVSIFVVLAAHQVFSVSTYRLYALTSHNVIFEGKQWSTLYAWHTLCMRWVDFQAYLICTQISCLHLVVKVAVIHACLHQEVQFLFCDVVHLRSVVNIYWTDHQVLSVSRHTLVYEVPLVQYLLKIGIFTKDTVWSIRYSQVQYSSVY